MASRSLFSPLLAIVFSMLFGAAHLVAENAQPPAKGHRPPAEFDELHTPLQKAVKDAYRVNAQKKKDGMPDDGPGGKKDLCAKAIENGNENQIANHCADVGELTSEDFGGSKTLKHENGNAAGKRLVTKTTLHYRNAKQKGRPDDAGGDKWPAAKLRAFERVKDHFPGPAIDESRGGRGRSYGSSFLPESGENDDRDCIDTLTGEHHAEPECFGADGSLNATLTLFQHESGAPACQHVNGSVFFGDPADGQEDDCWGADNTLRTTLIELIDEDGPEELDNDGDGFVNEDGPGGGNEDGDCIDGSGTIYPAAACSGLGPNGEPLLALIDEDGPDLVDNDGDGAADEDAPPADAADECARFYEKLGMEPLATDKDENGQCDVGRALVKFANDKAEASGKGKIFKAKDDGTYDPNAPAGVEPGTEERKISITESFGVKCAEGTTFIAGVCIPDSELAEAGEGRIAALGLLGGPRSVAANTADDPTIANVAMMGFTFAPPVIEWGYRIDESVCIFGFCIEVFYARIGYEFDLALGLRLPVEVEALDLPASVLAGEEHTILTQIEPLDFTTSQYEAFCHEHALDSGIFIGGSSTEEACRRFGFTNFLDAAVPDTILSRDRKDGDEFVARYSIFAGIQVRVLMIPIINWAIDSSLDIPAACTMMRIFKVMQNLTDIPADDIADFVKALMGFGGGGEEGVVAVLNFLKDQELACGTFTTPFGRDDDGGIRGFPFSGTYDIRADCAEAFVRGEVITINGQPRPICTNMILGVAGASLGVGLGLEVKAGSDLIRSNWVASEDADGSARIDWNRSSNEDAATVGITIEADNFDATAHHDTARISLDDFIYYLNLIEIALKANIQFGGILSPIPDIGSFNIYRFQISLDDYGLPIGQHAGTGAVNIEIPVENYALEVDVRPDPTNPDLLVDADTVQVVPGEYASFDVSVTNLGSVAGGFDNFRVELSNRPDQSLLSALTFEIDPNNDQDCRIDASSPCILRGVRWDGVADDCYSADGMPRIDRIECKDEDPPSLAEGLSREERDDDGDGIPDEDPPDVWAIEPGASEFQALTILGVAPYTSSAAPSETSPLGQTLSLRVSPFRHPLTAPGIYPIRVTADSIEAKAHDMAAADGSGNARRNAIDVSFLSIESFFEPQIVVLPNSDGGKPGVSKLYTIEGTNGGNSDDSMSVANAFVDFNQGNCTLTTLGRLASGTEPDCPYRAVPTAIAASWTNVGDLAAFFPELQPGQLEPLGSARDSLTISPPREWAGMEDTVYQFVITTISQEDPAEPAAHRSFVAEHTVNATKESMTRYIGFEIAELIATLEEAGAAGVKLGGLKPIAVHPVLKNNESALSAVLAGDLRRASGLHSTGTHLMKAFVHALNGGGKGLPSALFADLHARAAAILEDLARAEASMVVSAPQP